jgi:hypothetical protein
MAGVLAVCTMAVFAGPAQAAKQSVTTMSGFAAPGTPAELNKVIVLKQGDPKADHVLVLIPGTSAGAAYFAPLAKSIVSALPDWQVWSVERRENLLEDHSELDQAICDLGLQRQARRRGPRRPRLHRRRLARRHTADH